MFGFFEALLRVDMLHELLQHAILRFNAESILGYLSQICGVHLGLALRLGLSLSTLQYGVE